MRPVHASEVSLMPKTAHRVHARRRMARVKAVALAFAFAYVTYVLIDVAHLSLQAVDPAVELVVRSESMDPRGSVVSGPASPREGVPPPSSVPTRMDSSP
jgi:hypothetical protein